MAGRKRKKVQCTGTTRAGERCKRWVMPPATKCASHGGATPRGKESPHYRHGLFSLQREMGEVHCEVYHAVLDQELSEDRGAEEIFAYSVGKLAELAEAAKDVNLSTQGGRDAQKVALKALDVARMALRGRVEVKSVLSAPPPTVPQPIAVYFGNPPPGPDVGSGEAAPVDGEVHAPAGRLGKREEHGGD